MFAVDVNGVNYSLNDYDNTANVTGITSTDATITIPAYVYNGDNAYKVTAVNSPGLIVSSSTVETLIFKGPINIVKWERRNVFDCPNLREIYFKGGSPTFTGSYSGFFGTNNNITAYVVDKTDEEIATMKESYAVWSDFADIISYNEAKSENVNVYITVEGASCSGSNGGTVNVASGSPKTEVVTRAKHTDFNVSVLKKYGSYELKHVYVNGKDVLEEMYYDDGTEKYIYTARDMTSDVYIRCVGESNYFMTMVGNDVGGKITYTIDGGSVKTIGENAESTIMAYSTQKYVMTITPNEGYEFYRAYKDGQNITTWGAELGGPVTVGDGTYTITNKGEKTYYVILYKAKAGSGSGSGSGVDGYDLNGDGNIDVSDIDKLIEKINEQ